MMVPVLIAMAVGPMLSWKRGDLLGALQRLWIAFAVAVRCHACDALVQYGGPVLAVFGIGLAVWTGMARADRIGRADRLFRIRLPKASGVRSICRAPPSA